VDDFPRFLYEFRRAAEGGGFLDKYHLAGKPHWKDDECSLRLGTLKGPTRHFGKIEKEMRDWMANQQPILLDITIEDVSIVLYDEPSLKPEEVLDLDIVPLLDALEKPSRVAELYGRLESRLRYL
jgi:hypothetical protein